MDGFATFLVEVGNRTFGYWAEFFDIIGISLSIDLFGIHCVRFDANPDDGSGGRSAIGGGSVPTGGRRPRSAIELEVRRERP